MADILDHQDHTGAGERDEGPEKLPVELHCLALAAPALGGLKRLVWIKVRFPVHLSDASDATCYVRLRKQLLDSLKRSEQVELLDCAAALFPDRLASIIDGDVTWNADAVRAAGRLSIELAVRCEASGLDAALVDADERSAHLDAELDRIEEQSKRQHEFQTEWKRLLGPFAPWRPNPSLAPEGLSSDPPPPNIESDDPTGEMAPPDFDIFDISEPGGAEATAEVIEPAESPRPKRGPKPRNKDWYEAKKREILDKIIDDYYDSREWHTYSTFTTTLGVIGTSPRNWPSLSKKMGAALQVKVSVPSLVAEAQAEVEADRSRPIDPPRTIRREIPATG